MDVFDYDNYREILSNLLELKEKNARGQKTKLADSLSISSSYISQVLKGNKTLTSEQALIACDFFKLNSLSSEYLLLLVQRERAGHPSLGQYYDTKIEEALKAQKKTGKKLEVESKVSEKDKTVFYSDWLFSAIFILCSIDKYQTEEEVLAHFNLPIERVQSCLNELIRMGLLKVVDQKIVVSEQHLYLSADDPLVFSHHKNFRIASFNRHNQNLDEDEILLTIPLSIAKSKVAEVRKEILSLIQKVKGHVEEEEPEVVMGLNIDWFKLQ